MLSLPEALYPLTMSSSRCSIFLVFNVSNLHYYYNLHYYNNTLPGVLVPVTVDGVGLDSSTVTVQHIAQRFCLYLQSLSSHNGHFKYLSRHF